METSKELKTPTQHMMIWVLQNFEKELENDIDKDKSLEEIFDQSCHGTNQDFNGDCGYH